MISHLHSDKHFEPDSHGNDVKHRHFTFDVVSFLSFFITLIIDVIIWHVCDQLNISYVKLIFSGFAAFISFLANLSSVRNLFIARPLENRTQERIKSAFLGILIAFLVHLSIFGVSSLTATIIKEKQGSSLDAMPVESVPPHTTVDRNNDLPSAEPDSQLEINGNDKLDDIPPPSPISSDEVDSRPIAPQDNIVQNPEAVFTPGYGIESIFDILPHSFWDPKELADTHGIDNPLPDFTQFVNYLDTLTGQLAEAPDEEINGNPHFVQRVQRANQLENDNFNCQTISVINEIILDREAAFQIYPTKGLCILLFNDYHKRGLLKAATEDYNSAYDDYIKAMEYRINYLQLHNSLDNGIIHTFCYDIGIVLQNIADIHQLAEEYRIRALSFSARILELSYQYSSATSNHKFESIYYAAFAQHKLLLIAWNRATSLAGPYIDSALSDYNEAYSLSSVNSLQGKLVQNCKQSSKMQSFSPKSAEFFLRQFSPVMDRW